VICLLLHDSNNLLRQASLLALAITGAGLFIAIARKSAWFPAVFRGTDGLNPASSSSGSVAKDSTRRSRRREIRALTHEAVFWGGPATQINGRVVDNTLQQFVLFLVATTALSVNLTPAQMRIIPAAAMVFVMARAAFWIGYSIHPLYRAFGMAATGYLNVGLLGFALWKATLGS
jgi:hypothetical protein